MRLFPADAGGFEGGRESRARCEPGEFLVDQAAWAYLSVIWCLLDDPRETWLADYERFVLPIQLPPPEGHEDIAGFMEVLACELRGV